MNIGCPPPSKPKTESSKRIKINWWPFHVQCDGGHVWCHERTKMKENEVREKQTLTHTHRKCHHKKEESSITFQIAELEQTFAFIVDIQK